MAFCRFVLSRQDPSPPAFSIFPRSARLAEPTLTDSTRPYPAASSSPAFGGRKARHFCRAQRGRDVRPRRKTERGSLSPRKLERKAPRSVWATQLPASRPIRWIVRESREANRTDFARIPSDGLRDAPRASTDGLARFLSDKLRSRSRASIGRTHIRNPLARFPTDGFRPH